MNKTRWLSFSDLDNNLDCYIKVRIDDDNCLFAWLKRTHRVCRAAVTHQLSSRVTQDPWSDTQLSSVVCLSLTDCSEGLGSSYRDELSLEPAVIFEGFIHTNFLSLQFHFSMIDIWILSWWVISPDNDILYILSSYTEFKSNLVQFKTNTPVR